MLFFRHYKIAFLMGAFLLLFSGLQKAYAQQSQQPLEIQAAQLSGHARLGFNVPVGTVYRIERANNKLRIVISGNYAPNLLNVRNVKMEQIGNPIILRNVGETAVVFDVLPGVSVRDFHSGDYLIVDVYGGADGAVLPSSNGSPTSILSAVDAAQAQDNPSSSSVDGDNANTQTPTEATPAASSGSAVDGADTADSGSTPADVTENDELAADLSPPPMREDTPEPIQEEEKQPEQEINPADYAPTYTDIDKPSKLPVSNLTVIGFNSSSNPEKTIPVSVAEIENGVSLTFDWSESVAAAVFERGGILWVVFDQPYMLDPRGMMLADSLLNPRISSLEYRPHKDALIFRMSLVFHQNVIVERDQNKWIISLKDTPTTPRFPLKPERRVEGQGQQIFIPAEEIGRKIEVDDPEVGDQIIVLPLNKQGNGLLESYSYASAELLQTAQGIAVTPLTDFVDVERFNDGIIVRSSGNNILSATQLSRATGVGDAMVLGFSRLIDFDRWRIGPAWEYRKNKARLFYELSLQPLEDRNGVRWKLARYYLAHGRAAECLGILELMLLEDPLIAKNTEYLAVRGVANYKQGRLKEALADLTSRELEAEQDAELWLSLVTEKLGQYETALEYYRRGRDVMGTYDAYDRAEIQLAVIRSYIETGDLEQAKKELDLLSGIDLTEGQVSESVYQSARIEEQEGQFAKAYAKYDDLSQVPQRWIAARARYSRAKFALLNGDIDVDTAIDQLERLRYAWRGDRFEAQLLDDLASLYFSAGKYEEGLESLRQGISYYPEVAKKKRMLSRMGDVFRDLFLNGQADNMSPISAIGLFYKFRDLTPLGTEGDLMIRRLADRLVSVDLLGRAAELLEYQVSVRTEGAARAQIAANLAKIYILDETPEKALEIMRATREPRLPEDIMVTRQHVEARALIEMSRFEEAEVLLEDDKSAEADLLRADIFWGAKEWAKFTPVARRLLGDGWRRNEPITSVQRLNLLRLTIAMTFTEDRAGLIEMRRRYLSQMQSGDFANAFALLTNDQELSGRELGQIASEIASVEKLQSFMRDYRSEFSGR